MQSFSQHLVQLVVDDVVDLDVAAAAATNRHDFEIAVEKALREKHAADAAAEAEAQSAEGGDEAEAEPEPEGEPVSGTGTGLRLAASDS
jgi:hypothetical protein